MKSRRQFLIKSIPAALGVVAALKANAQDNRADENSAPATGIGYKNDASKVDAKKYPTYVAGRNCANCMLYQGKPSDPWASCAAVGGKQVNAKGWCVAWSKRA
jgi:hypothetical protein